MHDIQAHLRSLPMSAQKVRLVVDLIRGKDANSALEMLRFVNKAAALPVDGVAGGVFQIFTNPSEKRTEDYVTGRFG